MLQHKTILIIESEFLIALDIQRILENAKASKTVFARSIAEVRRLEDRLNEFDLVVMDVSRGDSATLDFASVILKSGVAIVATTADVEYRRGIPHLAHTPVVLKPFEENQLVGACNAALAPRLAI